jgi:hypothetical protein
MPEISDALWADLIADGLVEEDDRLDSPEEKDDDDTSEPQSSAATKTPTTNTADRDDILERIAKAEAAGDHETSLRLKLSISTGQVDPSKPKAATESEPAREPVDIDKAIEDAEERGDWRSAFVLKTRKLVG